MAEQGGLQLIPQTKRRIEIKTPGANRLLVVGLILLAAGVGVWFLVHSWLILAEDELAQVSQQIQSIENDRNKQVERDILRAASQLTIVSTLVKDHTILTRGFERLESLLKPDVQLKNLSISVSSGKISAQASARSYTTIARQLAVFLGDELIKDTKLSPIESDPSGKLEFGLEIIFDEQKLIRFKGDEISTGL